MNKSETYKTALEVLENLQEFTKKDYPIGTKVTSKRGRGLAEFTVCGYPDALSVEAANSVLGRTPNNKIQTLTLGSISGVIR